MFYVKYTFSNNRQSKDINYILVYIENSFTVCKWRPIKGYLLSLIWSTDIVLICGLWTENMNSFMISIEHFIYSILITNCGQCADIYWWLYDTRDINTVFGIAKKTIIGFITYAKKFPYIILLTATDQYVSISGV